jgi:hypothetical protein
MSLDHLKQIISDSIDTANAGAYYGAPTGLSLGAGLIYSGVQFAQYNSLDKQFEIIEGPALVLTNECDVANERDFNEYVLICPIITLEAFAATYVARHGLAKASELLRAIAANTVYRVFLLPPPADLLNLPSFQNGGLLYLNQICSTHVSLFGTEEVRPLCALSQYGQQRLDQKLTNHLLRPKDELLPLTR